MPTREKSVENYSATASPAPVDLIVPRDCAGLRFDQALARLLPEFSRSRLSAWMKTGNITVDGAASLPKTKVWGGEKIHVIPTLDPQATAFRPENIPLNIVDEDDALIVINKPAGLVVHPGSGNWQGTMLNALLQHAPTLMQLPRAGIVHRLDKDTSGLLVVAKTLTAQTALVRQLQAHSVTREYLALVHGTVAKDGSVDAPIGRDPRVRTRMAIVTNGKAAITHYQIVDHYAHATLLRCRLETGRTHQIRVHLASISHPLVGDPVYGARKKSTLPAFTRQALHAERLALIHPATKRRRSWHAALPDDMRHLLKALEPT